MSRSFFENEDDHLSKGKTKKEKKGGVYFDFTEVFVWGNDS